MDRAATSSKENVFMLGLKDIAIMLVGARMEAGGMGVAGIC